MSDKKSFPQASGLSETMIDPLQNNPLNKKQFSQILESFLTLSKRHSKVYEIS